MSQGICRIAIKSVKFYRKPVIYQVLIIALLSAVITGSLLTGGSVRSSLKKTASEHLGNTGTLISSGMRYFRSDLVQEMKAGTGINCSGILELNGYCQSLNSQKGAFNAHIYAIQNDFFSFNGIKGVNINPGEVAINKRLADYLNVKTGEELSIRYKQVSDIPSDAPFAPGKDPAQSVVMRIGIILQPENIGNFSLSISQIMPMNIFINPSDIIQENDNTQKINRLLIDKTSRFSAGQIKSELRKILTPADIGLKVRMVRKTRQPELISDRIFIDAEIVNAVHDLIPSSAPLITYLANRFQSGSGTTPYSFVSALPASLYSDTGTGDSIIISRWMADDLSIKKNDPVEMFWYSPDSLNDLKERSNSFVVKKIVEMKGIWSDSLLMPEFQGISGRQSCSDWDAGVLIKLKEIRPKDEAYWNEYRGTPKASISYEKGKELWGNNYGPATAIRFPEGVTINEINGKLNGTLDPGKTGFTFTDLSGESLKAADESVDFGSLFLSLGFFLIVASVVLLSFAVSAYFNIKKEQIRTLFALGFNNNSIQKLFFIESVFITITGAFLGVLAGLLVNSLITHALNSVWRGAVQTDTLDAFLSFLPLLMGFIITTLTTLSLMFIKVRRYLIKLNRKENEVHVRPSSLRNLLILVPGIIILLILFVISILYPNSQPSASFATGTVLLIVLILFWRQLYIGNRKLNAYSIREVRVLSRYYYSINPSNAVTPILFIAAGIFAVMITSVNKMNYNDIPLTRKAGTGGYLLWCESTIPVKEDLNSLSGKKSFGFDSDSLSAMSFIQIKRSLGNDASCLNLNHIATPPLLGIDPDRFISGKSFSFSKVLDSRKIENPWKYLNIAPNNNTIFGIADQTVLEWGLKLKIGDTLTLRAENGQPLNIVLAAGLKSSVFQGYVLIGKDNFTKYYPSVSGTSVMLIDGKPELTDLYKTTLEDRLQNYGVNIEKTTNRLASFYEVTNTYLSVFGVFGALGMITGIAGLGFVLLRNYDQRKKEFALMMATGFSLKAIRSMILSEEVLILFAGVSTGVIAAVVATLPSIKESPDIPWLLLLAMVSAIILSGLSALLFSVRSISTDSLTVMLRKE